MRKSQLNFIIDSIAFAGFVFLSTTGVLMKYLLPPGSGHFSAIWGLDRHQWGDIHFWVAIIFFSVLVFHLFLHWRWIICMIRGRVARESGKRFALGLIGVAGIIAISLAPLISPVEQTSGTVPYKGRSMRSTSQEPRPVATQKPSDSTKIYTQTTQSPSTSQNRSKTNKTSDDKIIRGYMTLGEIEEHTGIPYEDLLARLNITENVESQTKTGRFLKEHGFTMKDLRVAIDEYRNAH